MNNPCGENSEYRQIRVFLSSTFTDMQPERDALVKLFRRLAVEGRKKNVSITLLDLRWGITDDQKRNGKVISTCLQEIDNSKPYFIGILGERYGWIPSSGELEGNNDLISRFPEISNYSRRGLSITEIEMRHGVLDKKQTQQALFLKKKGVIPESEKHKQLINEIDASKNTLLFEYSSVEELINIVEREFSKVIEGNINELSRDKYEKVHKDQERILIEKREGYIPIANYKGELDKWNESEYNTIVIAGQPGIGKTSFIADWIVDNKDNFDRILYYFIGEGEHEDSVLNIQKYIIHELEKFYNYDFQIDDNEQLDYDDDYSFVIEHGLSMVASHNERLLLVIDGLDHLNNQGTDKFLLWLPEITSGIKVIFTTSFNDLTFNSLTEIKNFPVIRLEHFSFDETKRIIVSYLENFSKSLDPNLVDLIASNSLFRNGSVLRILLDDLIAYGSHEQLPLQIKKYATTQDKQTFFNLILERAEEFYGKDRIENILTLLLISNKGLEETDIKEILGWDPIKWSEIYCGLKNYLVFIDGKYNIRHLELKEAVISRYYDNESLNSEDTSLILSRSIINQLKNREGEEREVAFQAFTLEDKDLLYELLSQYEVTKLMILKDEAFAGQYWKFLEEKGYSFEEFLNKIPKDKKEFEEYGMYFIQFADLDLNNYDLAVKFGLEYLDLLGDSEDEEKDKIDLFLILARLNEKYNHIDETENYLELAKSLLDKHYEPDDWNYGNYFFSLGNLLYAQGEYEKALDAHKKAESLELKNKYYDETYKWSFRNRIGMDLLEIGKYDEAYQSFKEALNFVSSQTTSSSYEASQILNNIGYCLLMQGNDLDEAENYLQKALNQMASIFGENNMELFLTVTNLGILYLKKEEYVKAKDMFQYAYNLLEENKDIATDDQMGSVCLRMGEVQYGLGNYNDSIEILKTILKNLAYNGISEQAYRLLGDVYIETGKYKEILKLYEKWAKEAMKFYDGPNYVSAYAKRTMGDVYLELEKYKKAFKEFEDSLSLYIELGAENEAEEIRKIIY